MTARDRKKTGMSKTGTKGKKYPVATKAQMNSAIRLRHHGKGVSASAVLAHVAAAARRKGYKDVLAKVAEARKKDRARKK